MANVWLGRCVSQLMTGQVTKLSEGAAALLTDEGLVPSVNALVRDESTGTSECSAALIAHVFGLGLWTMALVMHDLFLTTHSYCVSEMCCLERTNCFFFI